MKRNTRPLRYWESMRVKQERLALAATYGLTYSQQVTDLRATDRADKLRRLAGKVRQLAEVASLA